jgi:hypothetical protein
VVVYHESDTDRSQEEGSQRPCSEDERASLGEATLLMMANECSTCEGRQSTNRPLSNPGTPPGLLWGVMEDGWGECEGWNSI